MPEIFLSSVGFHLEFLTCRYIFLIKMIILCYLDMINDSMHVKKYETMVEFCYIVFYITLVTIFMRLLMMKKFTSNVMGD